MTIETKSVSASSSGSLRVAEDRVGDARGILEWAFDNIDGFVIGTSFQLGGLINIHIARELRERVPVLFLQTGFHFPETLDFRDGIVRDWGLELIETEPTFGPERQEREIGPELYRTDPDLCCHLNKVMPLEKVMDGRGGWGTGVRRDQSPTRATTEVFELQELSNGQVLMKVNPLAHWRREEVEAFADAYDLPRHPLYSKGFASIGCAPCTRPIGEEGDERAGRWDGFGKAECGIHGNGGLEGAGHDERIHNLRAELALADQRRD